MALGVTVIIPTFNRASLLIEALSSVQAQTLAPSEIIVVDDGSTDDTEDRVRELAKTDKRLRYIRQSNAGPSAARNVGIGLAGQPLVAFLDSDDIWLPAKLERQVSVFRKQLDVDVVYCGFAFIGPDGERLGKEWPVRQSRGTLYQDLMYGNVIRGSDSAVVVKTSALRAVGGFDETLYATEDQDLWRRLALRFKFAMIEETLVLVRWHEANIQRDTARMVEGNLRHFGKMVEETPLAYRDDLDQVARQLIRESALSLLSEERLPQLWRFVRSFISRYPAYGRAIVALLPVLLASPFRAVYRHLPDSAKSRYRMAKRWMTKMISSGPS